LFAHFAALAVHSKLLAPRAQAAERCTLGNDKAISDFDAALKTMPKNAFALYGRGVAKLRKNKTTEGEADMAEAVKIAPHIAAPFSARGLAP